MRSIKRNIPIDYDLKKFSPEFIDMLLALKNYIIVSAEDPDINIWEYRTGKLLRTLHGHKNIVRCVIVSPMGHQIISCDDDCSINIWDVQTGQLLQTLSGHMGPDLP
jgi:WD40 repeat protein